MIVYQACYTKARAHLQTMKKASVKLKKISIITKTYLYNFDPLKPHFYIVKLGFTGIHIIFSYFAKNIDYGYSLEPAR